MATGTEPPATEPEHRGGVRSGTRAAISAPHLRTDRWWLAPAVTAAGLLAFRDENYAWGHMGLGTLVFLANIVLIWAYTLSCHSCRHIVGGKLKHFSKHPVRYRMWQWVGRLNARHMQLAWASLISVAAADFYVYLVASGVFDDPRFF